MPGCLGPLARLPRSLFWLGGAFVLLLVRRRERPASPAGPCPGHRPLAGRPLLGRMLGERASLVFAAELSVLYALGLGFICLRAAPAVRGWLDRLPAAGWCRPRDRLQVQLHPPRAKRLSGDAEPPPCAGPGPSYPFTSVPTPSTLPSGYSIRAAYFCLLVAAMVGARWPDLRGPVWLAMGVLAVAAAASRVTVGWHWPTDVIAGVLIGACSALWRQRRHTASPGFGPAAPPEGADARPGGPP